MHISSGKKATHAHLACMKSLVRRKCMIKKTHDRKHKLEEKAWIAKASPITI